jgi:hypothetical protein
MKPSLLRVLLYLLLSLGSAQEASSHTHHEKRPWDYQTTYATGTKTISGKKPPPRKPSGSPRLAR